MLTFNELKMYGRQYYPAILLEQFLGFRTRKAWRMITFILALTLFCLNLISPHITILSPYIYDIRGVLVIFFGLLIVGYLMEAFYLYHYFKETKIDYEVARLVYFTNGKDLTKDFLISPIGRMVTKRLGIKEIEVKLFVKDMEREKLSDSGLLFDPKAIPHKNDYEVNLIDYVYTIYMNDIYFRKFLDTNRVEKEDLIGTLEWVQNMIWNMRHVERFWSRENMMKVPSIGRRWYVREEDYLSRYTHSIYSNRVYKSMSNEFELFIEEAEIMQDHLLDNSCCNLLINSRSVVLGLEIVATFARLISLGKVLPKFEHMRLHVVNTELLLVKNSSKEEFLEAFIELSEQAANMSNTVLVITDLPQLIKSCHKLDIDIVGTINKLLRSETVPIIAITSHDEYSSVLETHINLLKHFDMYTVEEFDSKYVMRVLQNEVYYIEKDLKRHITYKELKDIVKLSPLDPKQALKNLHTKYE